MNKEDIENIVKCVPGVIEKVLKAFQLKVTQLQSKKQLRQYEEKALSAHRSIFLLFIKN